MEKQKEFTVHPFAKEFVNSESTPNIFALVYSKDIAKINGKAFKYDDNPDHLEGLVKITSSQGKSVYRKLRYFQDASVKSDEVQLDYRAFSILNVKDGDTVTIEPTNWFCYLWNYADSTIRWPFRIAVISIAVTFFFSLLSLLMGSVSIIIGAIALLK